MTSKNKSAYWDTNTNLIFAFVFVPRKTESDFTRTKSANPKKQSTKQIVNWYPIEFSIPILLRPSGYSVPIEVTQQKSRQVNFRPALRCGISEN